MRIVNLETFLALPEGTIYAKGEPFAFGSLHVKGETFGTHGDWWYLEPCSIEAHDSGELFDRMAEMRDKGVSYPMEDAVVRDGLYEKDAIFLVFEKADLLRLREMIDVAIAVA